MADTLIRFDWAMKRLLRQKSNFIILEGFLSELLKDDIKIQEILDSETNQETLDDKFNRADILAKKANGELIIVELQNNKEVDYFQRMLYGVSKVTAEHLKLGDAYSNLKKVYSVNIVYFELGQGKDYVYHGKAEFKGIHDGDILQLSSKQKELFGKEELYQLYPEYYVIKVNNFNDVAKDSLDEWIYYLKNDEVLKGAKAKGLHEVEEYLQIQGLSESERKDYYTHMENNRLAISLLETARMDGRAEAAKVLKANGVALSIIIEATGLSKREIDSL
jgi:predicted transposase/invertase (TIGR01784 family)